MPLTAEMVKTVLETLKGQPKKLDETEEMINTTLMKSREFTLFVAQLSSQIFNQDIKTLLALECLTNPRQTAKLLAAFIYAVILGYKLAQQEVLEEVKNASS